MFKLIALTLIQNASFTLLSRARNSKSLTYHSVASLITNLVYILLLKELIVNLEDIQVVTYYVLAGTIGSVGMHWLAMKYFEK